MQPCYVSIYPSELFTCSLHFKPRYTLLMGTPIHSQKQPASSPKPEIKVFSATVKSENLLVSAILGCQKLMVLLLQEVQFSPGGARKELGSPCPIPLGAQLGPKASQQGQGLACPVAPAQALCTGCSEGQGQPQLSSRHGREQCFLDCASANRQRNCSSR